MDQNTFRPIPTCEILMPILEGLPESESDRASVPRVLLQAAGRGDASRRVLLLAGIFLLLALLELALYLRLPAALPLLVYAEHPRTTLLGDLR